MIEHLQRVKLCRKLPLFGMEILLEKVYAFDRYVL